RKYSATARSGRTNQCDRGAKRDSGYIEVCAYRGRLATALGHRRSDQDDRRRRGGVPGLCYAEKGHLAERAKAKQTEPMNVANRTPVRVSGHDNNSLP